MTSLIDIREQVYEGKAIATVLVAPGIKKPYSFRGKMLTDGGVYIRLGGQTVSATLDEVVRIIQRGDSRSWEGRPTNEKELTFDQAKRIFDDLQLPFTESHYLGYGLLNRDREFTNLALLLSDQNPFRLIINTYDVTGKVLSSKRIEGSVLQQWLSVHQELSTVNTPWIDKDTPDFSRKETCPWPKVALREALTNTLAHRDYGSPLQMTINIHPDVMTFFSSGGIPPELTLEEALVEGANFCRNEKLADIFMRLGWLSKAGSGFSDIFRAYAPFPQNPRFQRVARSFLIELPRVNEQQTDRESNVIRFVKSSPVGKSRPEIEEYLQLSTPTVLKLIRNLKENGQLIVKGNGPSTRYFVPVELSS